MKAVIADELGPPDCYALREVPMPAPAAGEARVRVLAAGVGYFDALMARGGYQVRPPLPFVPGSEFAGIVESCGEGVQSPVPGQRVIGGSFGRVFAEYVCVPAATLMPLPSVLSADVGAAFLVNYQTAAHALIQRAGLRAGETLLVLGAAGGTGSAAVQVGKCLGARVIAAASSAQKRAFALAAGADVELDYSRPDWREELKRLSPAGVDVIFDPVGGEFFEPAFRSLAWGGRHLVIGFAGGVIPRLPANLALLKGASLVGVDLRQAAGRDPAMNAANTRQLLAWVEDGALRPPAGPVFEFADFRGALDAAFSGKSLGKVVLRIAAE
jgi:NADPH2:quinone reductase